MCSGNGINATEATPKELSGHMMIFIGAFIYFFNGNWIIGKTSRMFNELSPNGTGALFNGSFR